MNLKKLYKVDKPTKELYERIYSTIPRQAVDEENNNRLFWSMVALLFGTVSVPVYAVAETIIMDTLPVLEVLKIGMG